MGRDRSRSMSSTSSGRGAQSSSWDGEAGYRIHVSDLAAGVSRREIERVFGKFGPINETWVATNPPCFAFINFKNRNDAEKAIRDVDGKVIGSTRIGVSWARTRTYGGRNRGGRGAPYGSYRSGGGGGGDGGGSRRRSRSRSRSGSRDRRRRSRSRSNDRHRRRSESSRDRKRPRTERNGNGERRKSRTPRSRSTSRKKSPENTNKPSPSRGSSVHGNADEPNATDRSAVVAGDE